MHRAARNSITDFNENRLESNAMIGAPITTPKAYRCNHIAGGGNGYSDIARHVRQHAHNAKFRHAESESAQRQ